jgi:acetyl esterase/lipase
MKLRCFSRALLVLPLFATAVWAQSTAPSAPPPIQLQPATPAPSVLPANIQAGGPAIPSTPPAEPAHPPSVILWPYGAPGSEAHKNEAEVVGWRQEDIVFPIIYNIHNPSITPFLPAKDKATGCAVIVAPGGGHMFQTIGREGYDLGQWLADHGIAAFVLKYRLARDDANPRGTPQPYASVANFAGADAARAVRVIRSRASEWGVDPKRVGIIGFSAGGEVAAELIAADDMGTPDATDPIDRLDARPNFVGFAYPGLPQSWYAADWTPPKDMPPAFLLCASGDRDNIAGPGGQVKLYTALRTAKVPVELHIYEEGGHGFGVRPWSYSVAGWPDLFKAWLNDRGLLNKSAN